MKKLILTSAIVLAASFGVQAKTVTPAEITNLSNDLNAGFAGQQVDDITTASSMHAMLFGRTLHFDTRYDVNGHSLNFDYESIYKMANDGALTSCREGWGNIKHIVDNVDKVTVTVKYEFSDGVSVGVTSLTCPQ